jgi:positive regulator of sigma E activity
MYVIPLVVLLVLALIAVAWSPIFALVIFGILFVLFLGYVGISRRADEKATTPEGRAAARGREEEAQTRIR